MKRAIATWLIGLAPVLAGAQVTGSGTVDFRFLGFDGPIAASTLDNLGSPGNWIVPGLVNGVDPAASIPPYLLGWTSAGSPSSDIGFVRGPMTLAPTSTVSLRYASELPGSTLENLISFTPRPFTNVPVGQDFVLGTLTFQNGGWLGAGFSAADNVPTHLDFEVSTSSADGGAFNQTMYGRVTMVVHAPQGNDQTTLAGQEAEADFIYITDYADPSQTFGALRVFDECCRPAGAGSVGSVDVVARFNSLDMVRIANVQGGFITESIDPLPGVAPVPEPETYLMLLAGAAVVGWAARRRVNGTPGCASPARPAAA
jgi:PEP-CTERM motif